MQKTVSIVKIGGALLEEEALLEAVCQGFSAMGGAKILVHGGGQQASRVSQALGITPKMVDGRRITDADSLKVVVMVYGGLANKTLVARLQALGCNALGLSGADAGLIRARKRPPGNLDYGFVGDVEHVAADTLTTLLDAGLVPVFSALTHDGRGQLLNTNADTVAAEIAVALGRERRARLYYCFDKPGVLRQVTDPESTIPLLDQRLFRELLERGEIAAGMIPKLTNAFHALERGVSEVYIGPPTLLEGVSGPFTKISL
ncbi:acetylglutamate kinase [Robiginitalea marina]|uniref:Acetylglutamate kinase n=1 Tax=Robiginitalea marina TaxID=2954105 RepID=A0ABT1AX49_9FLAO|nr:acetylglutamate kinase [Robiginitalea marina]MCO5724624.1 acetylglutamate kinase [Robiginitalea marina]